MSTPLALATIEAANSQVGVSEQPPGSNTGPQVNEYLRCVHTDPGHAWCSAFCAWSVIQGAYKSGYTTSLKFSASALHFFDLNPSAQFGQLTADDLPCIVIYDHGGGLGHAFFAVGLDDATGGIQSIEGNSNKDGPSREGIGVFAKASRNISDAQLKGFLRIA